MLPFAEAVVAFIATECRPLSGGHDLRPRSAKAFPSSSRGRQRPRLLEREAFSVAEYRDPIDDRGDARDARLNGLHRFGEMWSMRTYAEPSGRRLSDHR